MKFVEISVEEAINKMPQSIHNHVDYVREQLSNGAQSAYKFGELYVIFEVWDATLMVQCVEGKGLNREFTDALKQTAKAHGFKYIQFVTPHKGLHRMVKDLNPERVEYKYICKV